MRCPHCKDGKLSIVLRVNSTLTHHACDKCDSTYYIGPLAEELSDDIKNLETILKELVFRSSRNGEILCRWVEDTDLSEYVSYPERLRKALQ